MGEEESRIQEHRGGEIEAEIWKGVGPYGTILCFRQPGVPLN